MLATDTINVQVVHGDALVAAGLAATLRSQADIRLVGCSAELPSGTRIGAEVDVLVTDDDIGLSVLMRTALEPGGPASRQVPVMIVSQRNTEAEIRFALERGARGLLLLGCSVPELIAAVRSLRAGARYVDARAAQRLADSVACEALTGREQAVLRLVADGLSNKAIARDLGIAIGTVKSHLKAVFQKLDAGSRTEVAAVAERRGLLVQFMDPPKHLPQFRRDPARTFDASPTASV